MCAYSKLAHKRRNLAASLVRGRKLVLQILFDRGISDRHVDQCALKARDELVVFDRIDGDAAVAPPSMPLFLARKPAVVYQFGWMIHLYGGVWLM